MDSYGFKAINTGDIGVQGANGPLKLGGIGCVSRNGYHTIGGGNGLERPLRHHEQKLIGRGSQGLIIGQVELRMDIFFQSQGPNG